MAVSTYIKNRDAYVANLSEVMTEENFEYLNGEGEAVVEVYAATIGSRTWLDPKAPGRPYLLLSGFVRNIDGDFISDIKSMKFDDLNKIPVEIWYEFDNDQLADLVKKGLYELNFEIPKIIMNDYEVAVNLDLMVLKSTLDKETPIIFADIQDKYNIEMTKENSGYDLVEYFEKVKIKEHSKDDDVLVYEDMKDDELLIEDEVFVKKELTDNTFNVDKNGEKSKQDIDKEIEAELSVEEDEIINYYQGIKERLKQQEDNIKEDNKDIVIDGVELYDGIDLTDDKNEDLITDINVEVEPEVKPKVESKVESETEVSKRREPMVVAPSSADDIIVDDELGI